MRVAHADYYVALVGGVAPGLRGAGQAEAVRLLGLELPNLRAAVRHLVYTNRLDDAGDFAWSLLVYWWISGFFSEVRLWMLELLEKQQPISQHTRAVAWFFALWGEMWQRPVRPGRRRARRVRPAVHRERRRGCRGDGARRAGDDADAVSRPRRGDGARRSCNEAVTTLRDLGDGWAESMAEVGLGFLAVVRGQIEEALAHFARSAEIADEGQNMFTRVVAGNNRTRVLFMLGEVEAAEQEWFLDPGARGPPALRRGRAYALEGICAVAAIRGDGWRAGALAAAAATIRQRIGVFDVEGFAVHVAPLDALRESDPERGRRGRARGRRHDRRRGDRPRAAGRRRDACGRPSPNGEPSAAARDPHPRPAAAGLRQLDPARARRRAARRARRDRAAAARPRDVRARRPPASAPRAVPLLPRAERRVRRHLRATATAGSRPTRRSPASRTSTTSPRGRCRSSSTSRRPQHRDERLSELIDRIRADDTAAYLPFDDRRRARGAGRRRPRDAARRAVRRVPRGRG